MRAQWYIKNLGELIFGSLHKSHVIHSASRNYTWKASILFVVSGVGHYIEIFWEKKVRFHYIKSM